METSRGVFGLGALLTGEVAAVGLLHRLGALPWLQVWWDDPGTWLALVPAEDAVMAALRLVALAGAYWLVVTTVCYTLARASRLPAAVRSVEWATLPAVRRVADRAVVVLLAGSSIAAAAPALAAVVPPPAVTSPRDLPGSRDAPPAAPEPGDGAPGPAGLPSAHVVVPGDNLWVITAAVLGSSATDAEIHDRWRAVVDANRDGLRSGDPDLIYPGERLVLPPHESTVREQP